MLGKQFHSCIKVLRQLGALTQHFLADCRTTAFPYNWTSIYFPVDVFLFLHVHQDWGASFVFL